MDGAADNGTASDAEKDAEELAEEEEEEEEGGKRKASKKKKTVAPLKIKIGAKGTPGAGTWLSVCYVKLNVSLVSRLAFSALSCLVCSPVCQPCLLFGS